MLGSDKTHLNNNYGDKKVHCVYMSCGNIDGSLRTKESAHCWKMVAQIPVVKFNEKEHQTLLESRLFHECMKFATESLKECSKHPMQMSDAEGVLRLVRTILFAHVADYPEQQLIACVSQAASPISLSGSKTLGDAVVQPLRLGSGTLRKIRSLRDKPGLDASSLHNYTLASKNVFRQRAVLEGVEIC